MQVSCHHAVDAPASEHRLHSCIPVDPFVSPERTVHQEDDRLVPFVGRLQGRSKPLKLSIADAGTPLLVQIVTVDDDDRCFREFL